MGASRTPLGSSTCAGKVQCWAMEGDLTWTGPFQQAFYCYMLDDTDMPHSTWFSEKFRIYFVQNWCNPHSLCQKTPNSTGRNKEPMKYKQQELSRRSAGKFWNQLTHFTCSGNEDTTFLLILFFPKKHFWLYWHWVLSLLLTHRHSSSSISFN